MTSPLTNTPWQAGAGPVVGSAAEPSPRPAAGPQPVLPSHQAWPLFGCAASRQIEQAALAGAAPHALMAAAGLGIARLALATAPQARRVWIAAGPGNNGGDGLVAARHLQQQGLAVRVSLLGDASRLPADAQQALAQARQAGVAITPGLGGDGDGVGPVDQPGGQPGNQPRNQPADLAIDALLGLGASRAPDGEMAEAVRRLNAGRAPVLAVDLPTGLCADSGQRLGANAVRATHTLALLTLKPGLFTGHGRDHAGRVWLDRLGLACPAPPSAWHAPASAGLSANPSASPSANPSASPSAHANARADDHAHAQASAVTAYLIGPEALQALLPGRSHAQHKGTFGDVLVLGGAPGMAGAAWLAARAALTAGAGRVYLARLDGDAGPDTARPELMVRRVAAALNPDFLAQCTVVCGCGGGKAVRAVLPAVLAHAARLVLDADGLNAVAADPALQAALRARAANGQPSVLTPHPLEAARLLASNVAAVQAHRLGQAQTLADRLQSVVVLKGSGSVIAAPGRTPAINPTGNARLASAGSGDVLAGCLGGLWSQAGSHDGFAAACASVWLHGRAAERGDLPGSARLPLRAADLIEALAAALPTAD